MQDIRERAFQFACRVIRLYRALIRRRGNRFAADQLVRAGTGIGSNLEEAEAAQSKPDFISKNRIALKEARETHYWLRIVAGTEMLPAARVQPLVTEANEIVAILTTIVKKASTPKSPHPD
jgi:four helix bundle protein